MMEEIPLCHIRIDKDGDWHYKGAPIVREDIYVFFNENLAVASDGRYILNIGNEKCCLEVEDTPFVIKRVSFRAGFQILLNDSTQETLLLDTIWIGENSILYCKVKDGKFPARFNRPSYYQFAAYIVYDDEKDKYFIPLDGNRYYIEQQNFLNS